MWAFGVFIYEMLVGTTPFAGRGNNVAQSTFDNVLAYANTRKLDFPWFFNKEAETLITTLLDPVPTTLFLALTLHPHRHPPPSRLTAHPHPHS